MYRNIPLGFSDTLVGATPSPGLAAFASSRTRLTAWLFHSRWSLFLHIRAGRMAAAAAGAKVFLGVDFACVGLSNKLDSELGRRAVV